MDGRLGVRWHFRLTDTAPSALPGPLDRREDHHRIVVDDGRGQGDILRGFDLEGGDVALPRWDAHEIRVEHGFGSPSETNSPQSAGMSEPSYGDPATNEEDQEGQRDTNLLLSRQPSIVIRSLSIGR